MGRNSRQLRISLAALFWGWAAISTALNAQIVRTESVLFQELKENYSALQNARSTFARELGAGQLNDQGKTDYSTWIQQLANQVVENCIALVRTNSTPLPDDPPCDQILSDNPKPADIDLTIEKTQAEKTGQLVEQMNQSLGGFDERLLREQDRVRAKKPRTDSSAQSGGGSGGGTGAQGESNDNSAAGGVAQSASGTAQNQGGGGSPGEDGASQGSTDETTQGAKTSRQGAPGKPKPGIDSGVPDDIPDGSDDDIVARQLREAAEKEQDPELREKLWEEYRRYKAGTS